MRVAKRIASGQLLVGLAAAAVWGMVAAQQEALAALAGGASSALLSFYAGIKTFGRASDDPRVMLLNFYRAQALKFALAIVLFGAAVVIFGQTFLPFISTFAVATVMVYWFSLLWEK